MSIYSNHFMKSYDYIRNIRNSYEFCDQSKEISFPKELFHQLSSPKEQRKSQILRTKDVQSWKSAAAVLKGVFLRISLSVNALPSESFCQCWSDLSFCVDYYSIAMLKLIHEFNNFSGSLSKIEEWFFSECHHFIFVFCPFFTSLIRNVCLLTFFPTLNIR